VVARCVCIETRPVTLEVAAGVLAGGDALFEIMKSVDVL
jgi:hypothetical protein